MKRFLMLLMVSITCIGLLATTAEARRLGGGGNFGKQRSVAPQQAPQRAPAATPAPAPGQNAAATPNRNRWLGPLAGLAIGAGLASMFGGGALGGAIGSIFLAVIAAVAIMFLISRFTKPRQTDMRYANNARPFDASRFNPNPFSMGDGATANHDLPPQQYANTHANGNMPAGNGSLGYTPTGNGSANIPHDFPLESFLRGAKASFIRLQAANDRKDLDDIREYTTPEMFAEISMQLMERDNGMQKTDVLSIDAQLLEAVTEGDLAIASVRYTGQIVENGVPLSLDEIWHVQRNTLNPKAGWLLAGIQQTQLQ